jgi:hypothetical protein
VLARELEINAEQQVMILAHNKSLLTYLHDAVKHRGIGGGSVGYYVGGMKEADLKASESKKIIIATYAMASEGLDIPTLTTLLMATPKTDVCQSVGRILRTKHSSPLVIDIIDYHDIFRNQWMKRQAYYFKQGYHIKYTNNTKYFRDIWKTRDDDASAKKGKSPFAGSSTATSGSGSGSGSGIALTNSNYTQKVSANPFGPFVKPKPRPTVASFFKMNLATSAGISSSSSSSSSSMAPAATSTSNACRIEL